LCDVLLSERIWRFGSIISTCVGSQVIYGILSEYPLIAGYSAYVNFPAVVLLFGLPHSVGMAVCSSSVNYWLRNAVGLSTEGHGYAYMRGFQRVSFSNTIIPDAK